MNLLSLRNNFVKIFKKIINYRFVFIFGRRESVYAVKVHMLIISIYFKFIEIAMVFTKAIALVIQKGIPLFLNDPIYIILN